MPDQELFDGEVKTTIEDDENIAFRKANPATPGSFIISWANFKTLLRSAFVALTGNQTIGGVKNFTSSPTVPDPTTDLQAANLRTLNAKTADPKWIDFVPQATPPAYKLARLFYDTIENTWTAYNDIDGVSLQLGEELRARLTNDTGGTLLNGAAVAVTGSVGINLKVELLDASVSDSSIRGFGLITIETLDGNPGYAVRFGAVRDLDTSILLEGEIIWGDPDVPGGLTTTRPKAPNYPVRIGICIYSDAVNGVIGVDTLAFNGTDTTVNIEGAINGLVTQTPDISFDASSGDIIATVANEAFPTKKLPFLLDGVRYLLDTITAPQTIIIPPGLSSSETQESILYIRLNAGAPELAVTTSTTISEPFAILSIQTVFNAIRTGTDGKPLSYRRYNDAMNSLSEGVDGAYGLLKVIMNWIRLRGGAGWTSGQDGTPTVDNANIKLAMTAGVGGQVHRANLPLFDGNSYLIYNDNANQITYEPSANLTDITETSAGVNLLANNVYYPIKLYYLLNSNGVGNDVIATRPSGFYTTSDEAKSDALKYGTSLADPATELNTYAVYTLVIGRTGGGGATISLIELQNNRKRTLKGEGAGGAGVLGGTDDKVRVSAADTTNSYLFDKIAAGIGVLKSIINPGTNEQLQIELDLADGSGTTANGNAVDLGGTLKAGTTEILLPTGSVYDIKTDDPANFHKILIEDRFLELIQIFTSKDVASVIGLVNINGTESLGKPGIVLRIVNTDFSKGVALVLNNDGVATIGASEIGPSSGFSRFKFRHDYSATWNALSESDRNEIITSFRYQSANFLSKLTTDPQEVVSNVEFPKVAIGVSTFLNSLDVAGGMAVGSGYAGLVTAPTDGAIIGGMLGVGISDPNAIIEAGGSGAQFMVIRRTDSAIAAGGWEWRGNDGLKDAYIQYGVNVGQAITIATGAGNPLTRMTILNNGRIGNGTTSPLAQHDIDQSSPTAAIPVIRLDQVDISEEMISFETTIGTGNPIEAVAAKTLTTTHFIKVTLPGGLTRYIPVGTIA